MCGIAGEAGFGTSVLGRHFTGSACREMTHRGPDETGFHDSAEVALGMVRLKVIGLHGGAQPTYTEDRSVVCVFNGEIYNHRKLRTLLEKAGVPVRGTSDAHVIPLLYRLMGLDFIGELEGMFAISLYDHRTGQLHLITDRAGKKPIFYSRLADGNVAFASEMPALLAHPGIDRRTDPVAIDQYLSYRVVPAPHTIYERVRKVPPATVLTFGNGGMRENKYWSFDFSESTTDTADAVDRVEQLFTQAVEDRLESEVPLGAMLSGGLDSSLVVAIASKLLGRSMHTFSVGFEQARFDESEHARAVAEHCGTEHHAFQIEPADARNAIDEILRHTGEPYAFPSAIASYYMYRLARKHVTVVLTGDGSDEIFCGYNRYKVFDGLPDTGADIAEQYEPVLIDGVRNGLKSQLYSGQFRDRLPWPVPHNHLRERFRGTSGAPLDRVMQVDCGFWLPDAQLVKIDRMAMAHSVEPRSPFLDHRLAEYVTKLPLGLKLVDGNEKAVLKEVALRHLPESTVYRRKQELAVPLESWLGTHLRDEIRSTLLSESSLDRGYFDPDRLREFAGEFRPEHSYALWTLFMLERWHQLFTNADSRELVATGMA